MSRRPWRTALALALGLAAALPRAAEAQFVDRARKTSDAALDVAVERLELRNGLVVLLAPDPSVSRAAVFTAFRAGTVYEPPGRSGLAHLVEHVLASGPTPDTDYAALLEARRAHGFNATTDFDTMTFEVVVPAEELPLALWVAGDRLRAVPALVDDAVVERNRRVVVQERALRDVDAPYGLAREHLFQRLYGPRHPLRGGVIGAPAELAAATASDVRAFVASYLVPANGVLAVVGRFDPAVARRLVEESFGALPPGRRAPEPALPAPPPETSVRRDEPLAREPRVTLAWRFPGLPHQDAEALRVGAQFLTFMTDGAWGMRISAQVAEYAGEAALLMELTVPYDEPASVVQDDAVGFLRYLTHRQADPRLMDMANLALDRVAAFELDTLEGRAGILTRVEALAGPARTGAFLSRHWDFDGGTLRDVASVNLRGPKVVVHARPTRPRPARAERP